MKTEIYHSQDFESELIKHGDNFRGAGYARSTHALYQYKMMLELVREKDQDITLLDLGCGLGHMLDYIKSDDRYSKIKYSGMDLSQKYLKIAQKKHPGIDFYCLNILNEAEKFPEYDYIVMNGIFNYKGSISMVDMLEYWKKMVSAAYKKAKKGIAFNVMSKIVDWEREDLFHLSFDVMGNYISKNLQRNFIIRHDYGRFEYTTYVYRETFFNF